jgi:hypothetical protein
MKALVALATALIAAPLAAADSPRHLAGISDQETTVPSGGVADFHRGHGDVLFVSDQAGRWYRLGLNKGCLSQANRIGSIAFGVNDGVGRIDHFTTLLVREVSGSRGFSCRVDSIRRSEAPPQINSKTPVTLD